MATIMTPSNRLRAGGLLGLMLCLGAPAVAMGANRDPAAVPPRFADRLVWLFGWNLRADEHVTAITNLLHRAAASGYNGAVLSAGLDSLGRKTADYFRRLDTVKAACDRLGLELIPSVFSVGYGGGALAYNRHLAEGLPVRDATFRVNAEGTRANFVPDPTVALVNGGFEDFRDDRFAGYRFHDQPGEVTFADTTVRHSGGASIRLEHFTANQWGHGRVMQEVAVRPWRCYRLSLWVKTESLVPVSGFQLTVLAGSRALAPREFELPATGNWRRITSVFNSFDFEQVRVYAGLWGGRGGRLWLDDWRLEEIGPMNVLRRPGTPVTVRSADGRTTYTEGRDYTALEDPRFNPYDDEHPAPPLKLLPGGRIRPGQELRVSWYHPMRIHRSQVTLCMAEPELYAIYDREAALLARHLHPRRVLLNMDEVRMGGTCEACRGRDMGKLLGECITRQVEILRRHNPGVQVAAWSDMLDPNHNAHGDYYLVAGSFAGSWRHVPKDSRVAVWGGKPRAESLRFFAEQGFQTWVACYYDEPDLANTRRWLELARPLPNVRGFMYTTWQRRYDQLEPFGALLH